MSPVPRNTVKQVLTVNSDKLVQIKCNLTHLRRGSSFLKSPGEEEEGEGKNFFPKSVTGSFMGQSPAQRHNFVGHKGVYNISKFLDQKLKN